MIEKLEKLGLSRIEAKVYLALIDIGPSFAGGIVAKTKQHRQQVYDALERLKAKRLVRMAKKRGKLMFYPANPEELSSLIREQEEALEAVLPELVKKYESPAEEVIVYHDVDGYKNALDTRVRITQSDEFIRVIGGTGKEFYEITKGIFDRYLGLLRKKRVGMKWIIYQSKREEFIQYFGKYLNDRTEARVLHDTQETPVATIILRDRIQISLFYPRPTVVEIVNKGLADEYQKYFKILWERAEKIVSLIRER